MEKIKALQLLVYIAFGLFILQNVAQQAWAGFKEGYNDGYYAAQHGNLQRGPLLTTVLSGSFINNNPTLTTSKVTGDYILESMTVNAKIRLSKQADTTTWWLETTNCVVIILYAVILAAIAITTNKVIVKIANGLMFDALCVKLIRRAAWLIVLIAIVDYVYQRVSYLKNNGLIHGSLKVINTSAFNFQILICAILVYIIAEAFKHGSRLKVEQDLTI